MGYAYEDLDDSQFERLVVQCMRKLFGAGVSGFATGRDGGRDARFDGCAERFPSSARPWQGLTIAQAKHTLSINAHFSDPDFSGDADGSVLRKELPRVKALRRAQQLDNYILFSNRRLGGVTNERLLDRISGAAHIAKERLFLAGVEYLDDMLREYPDLIRLARIDPVDGPLLVSSFDLAEVILAIADVLAAPLPPVDAALVDRVSYAEKNRINVMTDDFAATLSRRYLSYTPKIEAFLADPANQAELRRYEAAVEDFELKIVANREQYQSFDHVFNYLVDLLAKRDPVLARKPRLLRAMIFYMYWHCDIGETPDAPAE